MSVSGTTVTLTDNLTLNATVRVPAYITLVVPSGKTLTVAEDAPLTVTGTLTVAGALDGPGAVEVAGSAVLPSLPASGKVVVKTGGALTVEGTHVAGSSGALYTVGSCATLTLESSGGGTQYTAAGGTDADDDAYSGYIWVKNYTSE
ncbi:MAG: hypothetical protein LBR16_07440 [Treponema sp.]|nr:hypothetical protein [Treponema sp.]